MSFAHGTSLQRRQSDDSTTCQRAGSSPQVRSPLIVLTHSQTRPCTIGEGHQAQLYGHGETLFLSAFGYSILAKPAPKLHLDFLNMWQSFSGHAHSGTQGTSGWAGTTHTMLLQQALEISRLPWMPGEIVTFGPFVPKDGQGYQSMLECLEARKFGEAHKIWIH
ncbi:hypothetical protein DUI87_24430 [Hirundo rustica rustica]|uniref:Uncharacterized protein n=1 Tax=Hirundo rustica rustica TaxID=333673 RepID=A0A3M0JVC5_HIRRU|nr:hypothetical protein DUI87_24430 [Hirundo rustica rustica]